MVVMCWVIFCWQSIGHHFHPQTCEYIFLSDRTTWRLVFNLFILQHNILGRVILLKWKVWEENSKHFLQKMDMMFHRKTWVGKLNTIRRLSTELKTGIGVAVVALKAKHWSGSVDEKIGGTLVNRASQQTTIEGHAWQKEKRMLVRLSER